MVRKVGFELFYQTLKLAVSAALVPPEARFLGWKSEVLDSSWTDGRVP